MFITRVYCTFRLNLSPIHSIVQLHYGPAIALWSVFYLYVNPKEIDYGNVILYRSNRYTLIRIFLIVLESIKDKVNFLRELDGRHVNRTSAAKLLVWPLAIS